MKKLQFVFPTTNTPVLGEKVYKISIDYDRSYKSWYVSKRDKNGYQIDDAMWVHSKNEAIKVKKDLEKEYGIGKKGK